MFDSYYGGSSIWEDFKSRMFEREDVLVKLILINCIVFFAVNLVTVLLLLTGFSGPGGGFSRMVNIWMALPPDVLEALIKPWTFITYQFLHAGIFHILFNMIVLYWSGRIFQEFLGNRKLLPVFLMGGIAGGLVYLAAYQVFPILSERMPQLGMVGASASVFAVLVSIGSYLPNYTVNLIFFGPVRLKYIILVLIAIDLISLAGQNAGGHFAHLGGALFGYFFTYQLQVGRDLSERPALWFDSTRDFVAGLFGAKELSGNLKVHKNDKAKQKRKTKKQVKQEEIDRILDKIAQSGYNSLTDEEKETLFKASDRK